MLVCVGWVLGARTPHSSNDSTSTSHWLSHCQPFLWVLEFSSVAGNQWCLASGAACGSSELGSRQQRTSWRLRSFLRPRVSFLRPAAPAQPGREEAVMSCVDNRIIPVTCACSCVLGTNVILSSDWQSANNLPVHVARLPRAQGSVRGHREAREGETSEVSWW